MPSVRTLESHLGLDNDEHNDAIDEALRDLRMHLDHIGDDPDCKSKYESLLAARGTLGAIGAHIESCTGIGGDDVDERRADEYERLDEWLGKVMRSFKDQCVR